MDRASDRLGPMSSLELDWGYHAQPRVTALAIVEDLEVLEDRIRGLDPSPPGPAVQQLDLHPAPERLDHRIIEATPDRAHARQEPESSARRVNAQDELRALIRVDHRPVRLATLDGHAQGIGDQGGRRGIDRPADDPRLHTSSTTAK